MYSFIPMESKPCTIRRDRLLYRKGLGFESHRCLEFLLYIFLANVNSRSRSLYAIARPDGRAIAYSVCLSVVCL